LTYNLIFSNGDGQRKQTARKMNSGCHVGRLAPQWVIHVSLGESREYQAPQEDEESKNVPQENGKIANTFEEEEEDLEEVELYEDFEEAEQNDEEET
jgi:hypothetical protein